MTGRRAWALRIASTTTRLSAQRSASSIVPSDLQFPSAPLQAGVNFLNNLMVNTIDGQQTPCDTLDNPYPNGLLGPPHRNANYQQVLLGGNRAGALCE